jgi:hypothetical protein
MQVESGIEFGLLGESGSLWSETADVSLDVRCWAFWSRHTSRKASGAPPGDRYPYGPLSTDAVS